MHIVYNFLEGLEIFHNELEIGVQTLKLEPLLFSKVVEFLSIRLVFKHQENGADVELVSKFGHFLVPNMELLVQHRIDWIHLQKD